MAAIAVNRDEFVKACEEVYRRRRKELEKQHDGKLVALYEEGVASVGGTVDETIRQAEEKFPGKIFYVRRIGRHSAAGILF